MGEASGVEALITLGMLACTSLFGVLGWRSRRSD